MASGNLSGRIALWPTFFGLIDTQVPRSQDMHVVLENVPALKGPEVSERRASAGVTALIEAIATWREPGSAGPKPFVWHTAADILGSAAEARP